MASPALPSISGFAVSSELNPGVGVQRHAATRLSDGRPVIIETFDHWLGSEEEFRDECGRLLRLSGQGGATGHPHVAPYVTSGRRPDGRNFLVTLRPLGGTLAHELDKMGRLDVQRAVRLGIELAGAVAAIHSLGAIHGHLSIDTVGIGPDGGARLQGLVFGQPDRSEIGLARSAPEALGGGRPASSSDVHALGCLLFECVTGRTPHLGGPPLSLAELEGLVRSGPFPDPVEFGVDPDVASVISAATSADPAGRAGSAHEVGAALGAVEAARGWPLTPLVVSVVGSESGGEPPVGRVPRETIAHPADQVTSGVSDLTWSGLPPVGTAAPSASEAQRSPTVEGAPAVGGAAAVAGAAAWAQRQPGRSHRSASSRDSAMIDLTSPREDGPAQSPGLGHSADNDLIDLRGRGGEPPAWHRGSPEERSGHGAGGVSDSSAARGTGPAPVDPATGAASGVAPAVEPSSVSPLPRRTGAIPIVEDPSVVTGGRPLVRDARSEVDAEPWWAGAPPMSGPQSRRTPVEAPPDGWYDDGVLAPGLATGSQHVVEMDHLEGRGRDLLGTPPEPEVDPRLTRWRQVEPQEARPDESEDEGISPLIIGIAIVLVYCLLGWLLLEYLIRRPETVIPPPAPAPVEQPAVAEPTPVETSSGWAIAEGGEGAAGSTHHVVFDVEIDGGSGEVVGVGAGGTSPSATDQQALVWTSDDDGATWGLPSAIDGLGSRAWSVVPVGGERLVAAGHRVETPGVGGRDAAVWLRTAGGAWSPVWSESFGGQDVQQIRSLVLTANGGLVAVGVDRSQPTRPAVWRSRDGGQTWARDVVPEQVGATSVVLNGVERGGGGALLAVGQRTDELGRIQPLVLTFRAGAWGPDVLNGLPADRNPILWDVAVSGDRRVAVGQIGQASSDGGDSLARPFVLVSTDGRTWDAVPDAQAGFAGAGSVGRMVGVEAGADGFIAVGRTGTTLEDDGLGAGEPDARVWRSSDGQAWTSDTAPAVLDGPGLQEMWDVALGSDAIVGVGARDTPGAVGGLPVRPGMWSFDGG